MNVSTANGKENRPPKTNVKMEDSKRSSVPRFEQKSRTLNKQQVQGKNLRKKTNASKLNLKSSCEDGSGLASSQSRTRVGFKPEVKNFQTKAEEEHDIEKDLDQIYHLVIN